MNLPHDVSPLVLVIDDDVAMCDMVEAGLRDAGFRTAAAPTAECGLQLLGDLDPSLILLDVGLGPVGMGGLGMCRAVRLTSDVPVVLLSIDFTETDRLAGLAAGADDYLAKPISPRLLAEQVRAVLRRSRPLALPEAATILTQDGIDIDCESRTVSVHGQPVELTRIQFDLLVALALTPRRVLTRAQLIDQVWGTWFGSDHLLDVHISRLRAKIEAAGGPHVPHAVRGVGFRFAS